jgi:hypothetical protein
MKTIFLNSPEDCYWLRKTVLGGRDDIKFESFVLYGNEDAPSAVDLYTVKDPLITDEPHNIKFL